MTGASLTAEELVSTLRHSDLPAVVIEGTEDLSVWRHLEHTFDPTRATLMVCGGRDTLLNVFSRRGELTGTKVAFVADRDLWVFTGIPAGLEELLVTEGYSIENDAYSTQLEDLLTAEERRRHGSAVAVVCEWFAFAVHENLNGGACRLDHHPCEICDEHGSKMDAGFAIRTRYAPGPAELAAEIREHYRVKLRGKQLVDLLAWLLNSPKRGAKYSKKALLEMSIKLLQPLAIRRLVGEIESKLGLRSP